MIRKLMETALCVASMLICSRSYSQMQACPVNINFSSSLTHWFAYTGNNRFGNGPSAIKAKYDSTVGAPSGTLNVSSIPEYNLASVPGIRVETVAATDPYGLFSTVPVINGYSYNYSILLGSTSITRASGQSDASPGGYIRGVSYQITVPAGPASEPYTMTYAYAMVLENGAHNSNQQPLFSATLATKAGIITCASPSYYLPTLNDANPQGGKATLDTAAAEANGFHVSARVSPNPNPNAAQSNAAHLQDVWTKGWTEVTFDLSPYRGQQVTLTFEADNCVPGGHFAYAYIALRNTCAGLVISGDSLACTNSTLTYSIPALAGATYQWKIPSDWTLVSESSSNIIKVIAGNSGGFIVAKEQNGCANLADTLPITTSPPTIAGQASGNATVCAGTNTNILTLSGNRGSILSWVSSTDGGSTWLDLATPANPYTANNLTTTTLYKAVVQNSKACEADSSSVVKIGVDQKSIGGNLSPADTSICRDQQSGINLSLLNSSGRVTNWQSSADNLIWQSFAPAYTDTTYGVPPITQTIQYRVIVKNGVCPSDTSSVAKVHYIDIPFPEANAEPADTTICSGTIATLNSAILIGTSYNWTDSATLSGQGNGTITSTPYIIQAQAKPPATTDYILSIRNAGCPNLLKDTFHIDVIAPIIVNAGNDTAIVVSQPLQLNATSSDTSEDNFSWSPAIGLNNTEISDPLATLTGNPEYVRYIVKATDAFGCSGADDIVVRVFKSLPDIFVPNAFTPGKTINNTFRPIAVGISSLQFFRIYNRWGQLVYSTTRLGDGWDGSYGGKPQDTGSFVWMVQGTAYTGKNIFKKGTMTLVR